MRFVRFQDKAGNIQTGTLEGETIHLISGDFLTSYEKTGKTVTLGEVKLLSPVLPSKVVAVGRNYFDHAKELGNEVPKKPGIFFVPSTGVNDPDADVPYAPFSQRVDYEGELGVVIGKKATKVSKADAMEYVFGYCCVNDLTARDIQREELQWTRGKGLDGYTPIGPWITDEIDGGNAKIQTRVNGEIRQDSSTKLFMYDIPTVIEFITEAITLLPGDVIATGTPAGVGELHPGDVVEVEIEGCGVLRNRIV